MASRLAIVELSKFMHSEQHSLCTYLVYEYSYSRIFSSTMTLSLSISIS